MIQISGSDMVSTQICYQCASTLLAFSDLFELCLASDRKFKSLGCHQDKVVSLSSQFSPSDVRPFHEDSCAVSMDNLEGETNIMMLPESNLSMSSLNTNMLLCESSLQDDKVNKQREPDWNCENQDKEDEEVHSSTVGDDSDHQVTKRRKKKKDSLSKCVICGRAFQYVEYLKTHLLSHSEHRPHICQICGASFKRKDHINHHRKTVHMNHPDVIREREEKGESYLTCDQCGVVKPTKHLMVLHMKKHSINSQCDICGESFNLPSLLKEHLIRLHPKISMPCSLCGDEMKSGRQLFIHKRKHFISFICDMCGKRFAQPSSLRIHMINHSENKPFSCDECGKSFKLKTRLKVHLKSHSDDRPFSCPICKDKSFKTKSALINHNNAHIDKRDYPCPHCSFKARKNSDLVCHIRTHTGEKPYKCDTCGRGFAQAGDMRKHKATHERNNV